MLNHAPGMAWALIEDVRGALHLEEAHRESIPLPLIWYSERPLVKTTRHGAKLFTELNTWLLKVLLYKDASAPHRFGESTHVNNPRHLAKIAKVSTQTAYSFYNAFSEKNFLRTSRTDGIHLVRKDALLEMLIREAAKSSPVRAYACSIFGEPDVRKAILSPLQAKHVVGGFSACRVHGMLHTNAPAVWDIHIDDTISTYEKAWNFQVCGEQDAQVAFIESPGNGSVFRCAGEIDSLPVVDLLQAALDVAALPGRGLEQAESIVESILSWRLP